MTVAPVSTSNRSVAPELNGRDKHMSFAAMMVHIETEHDCEQRIQLALALADRFQSALIGVAGLSPRPRLSGGPVVIYSEPTDGDLRDLATQLQEMGDKFCVQGQSLERVEWRTALEYPDELVVREARAADLVIVGSRHMGHARRDFVDPGAILLRAGRPVLVVPDIVAPLPLRRVVVAWKDTRECRRAIRDALPFLQE